MWPLALAGGGPVLQRDRPVAGLSLVVLEPTLFQGPFGCSASGSGVHACILDTGIRATHVDFGDRVKGGYTAINHVCGTSDCNRHGTHTAGTLERKTSGVAKNVRLHPVRVRDVVGSGTSSG